MKLEVITPKGIELECEAQKLILPTLAGQIAVLPHHVALISVLKAGVMAVVSIDKNIEREIEGGILEVSQDKVVVLLKKF